MTARIAYFVHGRGRGHASRARAIVPALRARGHEVLPFASGDALHTLEALGTVYPRELVRVGPGGLATLLSRAWAERHLLDALGVDVTVSDGDQAALLAARAIGCPSLAIGHDLVFTRCALPAHLPRRHVVHQRVNALVPTWLSTRRVAVHFLPAVACDASTRVARAEAGPRFSGPRRERLVGYLRDPVPGLEAATRALCHDVVWSGGEHLLAADTFRALVGTSLGAIGTAGSNLIAECLLLGTPMLALYRADDAEQALNAELLSESGAGMACAIERLTPDTLADFWRRARAGAFAAPSLADELPSVVEVALTSVAQLLAQSRRHGAQPLHRAHAPHA